MKITVEKDDGEEEVYQNVTDAYLAVRQVNFGQGASGLAEVLETRSMSWGGNVRELTKELAQSLIELQDFLRAGRK